MGTTQKVVMFKRTPHLPFNLMHIFDEKRYKEIFGLAKIIDTLKQKCVRLKGKKHLIHL